VIPEDVLQFIHSTIASVWTLELLLLLFRNPSSSWSAESLNRELRASALVVADGLAALTAAGLVVEESPGLYRFQPARPEIGALLHRLAEVYAEFPFAVTQAILAAPNRKIRTFADAFRIKKD